MLDKFLDPQIVHYSEEHTSSVPELLDHLKKETYEKAEMPRMLSGKVEGRLLKTLVAISNTKHALEIGMYTGYSALNIAEALPEDGHLTCCEINPDVAKIAQSFFDKSPHGTKIEVKLQDALQSVHEVTDTLDFVFIDADKERYDTYFEAVLPKLRTGGLIVFDNTLWGGSVLDPNPDEASTQAIIAINDKLAKDPRVETVMLTVRDGVTLARKL